MRKTFFILLAASALFVSCGSNEDVPKTEIEKIKKESKEVEESGVSTPKQFNDGLMGEITRLDVRYAELLDYDNIDTTAVAIQEACDRAISEADEVIAGIEKFNVVGAKGDEFKAIALDLAKAFKEYAEGYKGMADVFSTPDKDWTDEMYDRWDAYDLDIAAKYDDISAKFNDMQLDYFDLNNLAKGNTVDVNSIYEEEKESNK